MSAEQADADLVTVGTIATAHGIRGELAVDALTDDPGRLAPGSTVLLVAPGHPASPRRILGARSHQQRLLLQLEGVLDRTAAERLRGARLCVHEADLPALSPGRVWLHELPGMTVVNAAGEEAGIVDHVLETGGDRRLLAVRGPRGEALVPFIEQFVVSIDREARRITIDPPDGLLP